MPKRTKSSRESERRAKTQFLIAKECFHIGGYCNRLFGMGKLQVSVDGIQKEQKHKLNPEKDLVVNKDGIFIQYEFNYDPSQIYSSGKIYFKNGKEGEARFFKFEKSEEDLAKKTFTLTSKLANYDQRVGVLKPHFLTYYEPQNIWILCYEKFNHLLSEINIDAEDFVNGDSRILSFWWRSSIRNLLQTIKHMHSYKFFHKGLNGSDNYVVVSGRVKIINIQSSFEDLEDPPSQVNVLRMNDLKAFRNMLKEKIMLPEDSWVDRDSFFDFFDKEEYPYHIFIEKLASHPFLLTPAERMKSFYSIHDSANESKFKRRLDDDNRRELTLDAAYAEVRRLYPDFLEKIHAIIMRIV
ncbi:hypothetical protein Prudu_020264, partial [Prunus dulcis]